MFHENGSLCSWVWFLRWISSLSWISSRSSIVRYLCGDGGGARPHRNYNRDRREKITLHRPRRNTPRVAPLSLFYTFIRAGVTRVLRCFENLVDARRLQRPKRVEIFPGTRESASWVEKFRYERERCPSGNRFEGQRRMRVTPAPRNPPSLCSRKSCHLH